MALVVQSLTTFNGTTVTNQDFEAVFGDGSKKKANRPQTAQPKKVEFDDQNNFEMDEVEGEADQALPMQIETSVASAAVTEAAHEKLNQDILAKIMVKNP